MINFVRKVAIKNARIVDAHVNIHDSPQKPVWSYLPSETGEVDTNLFGQAVYILTWKILILMPCFQDACSFLLDLG